MILADTRKLSRDEWLELRKMGIGGSDAAAIVGLNSYVTPYKLWAEKTGKLPEQEDNEAMRQGRDFEDYVAKRFVEATGKKVRKQNFMLVHDEYDFMYANIDRQIVGENAGLECKTTSLMNLKRFKNGEFPDNYYVQCMHYMAVTGADKWYLAVLVLNQGFYWFEIQRDEDEIQSLIEAEKEFWSNYVLSDVAPPVDGYKPTSEAINDVFRISSDEECQLMGLSSIESLLELQRTIKALEFEAEKLQQQIKIELGQCQVGYCDKYKITWKEQSRSSISKDLLKEQYPDLDISEVSKTSTFRVFKINKLEDK